jgi:hypothetical protein
VLLTLQETPMLPLSQALADEHIRDLHAQAARSRLMALATCCSPRTWRRTATRVAAAARDWVRRGQLGPLTTCCS